MSTYIFDMGDVGHVWNKMGRMQISQIKLNILSFQQLLTRSTPELPCSKHMYNLVLVLGMKKQPVTNQLDLMRLLSVAGISWHDLT